MAAPGADVLRALGLPVDAVVMPAAGGASGAAWRVEAGPATVVVRWSGTTTQAEGRIAAMDAARSAGLPAPELLGRASVAQGEVVVLSWLPGTRMLDVMAADPRTARAMGVAAGELQHRLHEIVAPAAVTGVTADTHRPFRAGADVPGVPDGDRLLHLDWHPLNLLVDADTGVISGIVDWDNARRGHPVVDLARTRSILTVEPALESLPASIRAALPPFLRGWTDGYGAEASVIPRSCLRWAGEVMLDDLAPRYRGAEGALEPLRRWTASWARGGIPCPHQPQPRRSRMPWPFSRKRADEPEPGIDPHTTLVPIRIITRDAEILGSVPASDERMTDTLQRGEAVAVLPRGASPDAANWLTIEPSEVQIVVPPPHVSPPERRLVRQKREVVIRIGAYELTGTAHLMPGAEQDILARSSHPFLPITDAALYAAGSADPERLEVVIVNLRETSEYRVV